VPRGDAPVFDPRCRERGRPVAQAARIEHGRRALPRDQAAVEPRRPGEAIAGRRVRLLAVLGTPNALFQRFESARRLLRASKAVPRFQHADGLKKAHRYLLEARVEHPLGRLRLRSDATLDAAAAMISLERSLN
jgi:hypothetical protein